MIDYLPINLEKWILSEEGKEIAETGSHEARVFNSVPVGVDGISIVDMTVFVSF